MNNSDGILCSSIHFLLSYNTSLWAWPCDLLWPMERKWEGHKPLPNSLLEVGLHGLAQPCASALCHRAVHCRWGLLLWSEPQKKMWDANPGSAHSLGQSYSQSTALVLHYGEMNVCWYKPLGFGSCLLPWQKPWDWRNKVYHLLSPKCWHSCLRFLFFFFCQSWEQMANPFALAPVSCSKWTFCFCFSKRTHRSPLPTPSNLMVNHQGYFVKESLRIIF